MTRTSRTAPRAVYNAWMADPLALTLKDLPAAEYNEIARTINAQPSDLWLSDAGDGMLLHAILVVAALGGVGAGLLELIQSQDRLAFLGSDLGAMFLLCVLALALLLRWVRGLYGRFGWMVTSFGYLQLRGERLRLIRWPDVVQVHHRVRGTGRNRSVTLAVSAANGTLESYFGALLPAIKQRMPPTARFTQDG